MFKRFKRKPKAKEMTQGKAIILARDILGPNVMVQVGRYKDGDYTIMLHPAVKPAMRLDRRHHAPGFDKRNDFVEDVFHPEEVIEEGYVLVAVGQTWAEALGMAKEWQDRQSSQTAEPKVEAEKVEMV